MRPESCLNLRHWQDRAYRIRLPIWPHPVAEEARTITDKPYVMVCDTQLFAGLDCLKAALPVAHYVAQATADWDAGLAEINAKLKKLTNDT